MDSTVKLCRDCKHWEQQWYDEEDDDWKGYGVHLIDGELINIGVCQIEIECPECDGTNKDCYCNGTGRWKPVKQEIAEACKNFESKDQVSDDIENLLFGDDDAE